MVNDLSRAQEREKLAGLILIASALLALFLANSPAEGAYHAILDLPLGFLSLHGWIADGLMAVFFLLVGLEVKREWLEGRLATPAERRLPILGKPGQRRDKCGRGFRARVTVGHKVGGKCQLAVYRYCIEKDVGCQRLFGTGPFDPAVYHLFPILQAVTAPRILGHHASRAIGYADLVQDVGDVSAGLGKPGIFLSVWLARFIDEGIVLIRTQ